MTRAFPDASGQRKDLVLLQEIASYLLLACGLTNVISVILRRIFLFLTVAAMVKINISDM